MKLIGSRTEGLIRERLVKYESIILENEAMYNFLICKFSRINSVYCLNQMIEQAEDIYTLLVNGKDVVELELSRLDNSVIEANIEPLNEYTKKIKDKSSKLTLAVAIDLSDKANNH